MNKGDRGIKSGLGTCACNDMLQCTCNVDRFRARNDNAGPGPDPGGKGNKDARDGKLRDRENQVLVSGARKGPSFILRAREPGLAVLLIPSLYLSS